MCFQVDCEGRKRVETVTVVSKEAMVAYSHPLYVPLATILHTLLFLYSHPDICHSIDTTQIDLATLLGWRMAPQFRYFVLD